MNTSRTIRHLQTLTVCAALWWFIENVPEDAADRAEVFFYLRERVRVEGTK